MLTRQQVLTTMLCTGGRQTAAYAGPGMAPTPLTDSADAQPGASDARQPSGEPQQARMLYRSRLLCYIIILSALRPCNSADMKGRQDICCVLT